MVCGLACERGRNPRNAGAAAVHVQSSLLRVNDYAAILIQATPYSHSPMLARGTSCTTTSNCRTVRGTQPDTRMQIYGCCYVRAYKSRYPPSTRTGTSPKHACLVSGAQDLYAMQVVSKTRHPQAAWYAQDSPGSCGSTRPPKLCINNTVARLEGATTGATGNRPTTKMTPLEGSKVPT